MMMRRRRRNERGYGAAALMVWGLFLIFLVHTCMIVMYGPFIQNAVENLRTTASENAIRSCLRAEQWMMENAPGAITAIARQINENPTLVAADNFALAQVDWPTVRQNYDYSSPHYGDGQSGWAEMTMFVRRPPRSRTLTNLSASSKKGVVVDDYEFTIRIRGWGRSGSEYYHVDVPAKLDSRLYIGLVSARSDSPAMAKILQVLEASGAGTGASTSGRLASTSDLLDVTFQNVPGPPGAPQPVPAAWVGDPEVVSGPELHGLPAGDGVYVYTLRGLPPGSTPNGGNSNVTILATDDWRFLSNSYVQSTDTIEIRANGSTTRRRSTPEYAVVAVRAPHPSRGLDGVPADYAQLRLPSGRVITLPQLPMTALGQIRELRRDGSTERTFVTGVPAGALPTVADSSGIGYVIRGDGMPGPVGPNASGPLTSSHSSTITVGGWAEDLARDPHMFPQMMRRLGQSGPVTIPLLSVVARRQLLSVSWPGGSSSVDVENSTNLSFFPEDAPDPGDPEPPDPTCTDCDPPPPRLNYVIASLFIDGDVVLLPPVVGRG